MFYTLIKGRGDLKAKSTGGLPVEDNMRIKKVSASEQVCEAIQEQISGGVWRVGDKLP